MATHTLQLEIDARFVGASSGRCAAKSHSADEVCDRAAHECDLFRYADDACRRAVVRDIGVSIAGAPVDVVRLPGAIDGRIAFVAVTEAATARTFAATVIVGNDVVLAVTGIVARPDPGHGRHVGTWRAGRLRAAAATA